MPLALLHMDLDLASLRTFAAVIDEGTFDAAARVLHITPSAVSQRIKALEQQVGRVLVQRAKPVRATESGHVVLTLARQMAHLEREAMSSLNPEEATTSTLSLVVNADSLSTWMIPALARLAPEHRALFDLHREDEFHSTTLLKEGTVMAAVTSVPEAVQGCTVEKLGSMRYRALCSRDYAERWLPDGPAPDALAVAPMLDFDRKDELQARFLRVFTRRRLQPPRHFVPGSSAFSDAVRHGLGWGLLPELHTGDDHGLVELDPSRPIDVPLYWQRWKLDSPILAALTTAVRDGAREALR
ncbi:chromosome replication initiation inhibitor protein [Rhodococcus opacus PD630]|nr:chromosome replication initiation inhibitor protein [Rhodococcus opacus PD630]